MPSQVVDPRTGEVLVDTTKPVGKPIVGTPSAQSPGPDQQDPEKPPYDPKWPLWKKVAWFVVQAARVLDASKGGPVSAVPPSVVGLPGAPLDDYGAPVTASDGQAGKK